MKLKVFVGWDPREDLAGKVCRHSIVSWYESSYKKLNAVHYTLGGPWFDNKTDCDFADLWLRELEIHRQSSVHKAAA
jgi:hypothetical protein